MKKLSENNVSTDALDVKALSEKMENLPHDKLMYVAGAVSALAATMPSARETKEREG